MPRNDPVVKQFVNVDLTQGVNKKRDAHQLRNGELLTADNVIFTNIDGQICKRNGFASVRPQGAPFQGGPFKAIGVRDFVEPLILGQNTLNRYNTVQNLSTSLPTPPQGRLEVTQQAGSSGKTTLAFPPAHASLATDGNQYVCATWCEPNGTGAFMYYGVQDLVTGNWIISPKAFASSVTTYTSSATGNFVYNVTGQMEPMVRFNGSAFWIFWIWTGTSVQGSTTYYNAVLMSGNLLLNNLAAGIQPNAFSTEFVARSQLSTSDSPTNLSYDVHVVNGRFAIATGPNQTNISAYNLYVGTLSGLNLTVTGTYNVTPNITSIVNRVAVRCDGPAATPYLVATSTSLNIFSTTGAETRYSIASSIAVPSTVSCSWINGNACWMGVIVVNTIVRPTFITITPTGQFINNNSGNSPVATSYGELLSRMFTTNAAGKVYGWFGLAGPFGDTVYNSAYLLEFDILGQTCTTVTRALYLSNSPPARNDKLRGVDVLQIPNTQRYFTLLTSATEKAAEAPGQLTGLRVYGALNRVLFDFAPSRQVQIVPLPTGGVMIGGAYPLYYDGNDVVEAGFSSAPTADVLYAAAYNSSVSAYTVGSGVIPGGTSAITTSGFIEYYYVICFVRRDSYGNVYRSAPSPVCTVSMPGANNSVTFKAMTYNGGGNVQIEYYRSTQNTPGTYYKIGVVPNGAGFVDNTPDGSTAPNNNTSITKNSTVYTNASELPNDPPPAIHHMVCSENRAYLIPADNRNVIWYSKQFSPGRTVEFCAALTLSEGLNSGQFTGLAVLDSNLIVFKNDQILYTYGNGPDNTGANGAFAPFQKIASDVGCIDTASIAVIPDGVVFKSRRGIELLTRSLQVVYIGLQVESLVASIGPLSSVVCMPMYTELRFIPATAGQQILTYDYIGKRWSTSSNMAATQAVNINNDYWWISADGALVNKETPGVYSDNGVPIIMTLETPEIPTGQGGIQGWGRVYRMALLGDFGSTHTMTVSFAYDHQSAYTDTTTFNTTSGLINGDTVYQFRCSRLPRSVMQTLRLKFQDSGTSGQSCAISNLALEVGSKNGLAKLPPAKTV